MDNHLNIFQAYHGGNLDSPDRINRLEDNLTRAFIITLKYLQEYNEEKFQDYLKKIKNNFIQISGSKHLSFDLQNMTGEKALKRVQKSKNKWVLLISRDPYTFEWNDNYKILFNKLESIIDPKDGATKEFHKKQRDNLLKQLKNSFDKNEDLSSLGISSKEVSSVYTLLHGCRPDAWIYDDSASAASPLSVLVEAKVGNNQFSPSQIYRHLSGELGYNLGAKAEKFDPKRIVSITWMDIVKYFDELKINQETIIGEILRQFKEYITMSGEILDLRKLNDNYDEDFAKSQFDLFLNKLDEKIKLAGLPLLARKCRRKTQLWDIYGLRGKDGKPMENPNFTIGFDQTSVGCSLTANKKRKFLLNDTVRNFLQNIATNSDYEPRQRYRYCLQTNRLIDWKNGQQQGDKYQAFSFFVNFAEKQWQGIESINDLIEINSTCMKKGGQEQMLVWNVDWVDSSKAEDDTRETPLRSANLDLFDNPDKLLEQIVDFFKELYPALLEMHNIE